MKKICKIVGIKNEGKYIRLIYKSNHVIEKPSITSALSDLTSFQDQMQQKMTLDKNPEIMRIPIEEYKKHRYNLDDTFTLEMTPGET